MSALNSTVALLADPSQFTFGTIDYIVFVVMLVISAGIGAYFGFFAQGADTTDEYLLGGRQMKTIPIAISLVASQLSGTSIMTIPAEMYNFGVTFFLNVLTIIWVVPFLCWVVIPVFYNNNMSNCYEYLEIRFDRKTRELMTFAFIATGFFMLPICTFIPALAFSQVTGISIHLINGVVCSICVFYTMFGGIKAVVWTDVLQAGVMVVAVIVVGIMGAIKVGGVGEVFRIAGERHRLDVVLVLDAKTRISIWNSFISATIVWASFIGLNQSSVQRIVSLPSLNHAKRSLVIFGCGFLLFMAFNCFTGLVMFAYYHDCDPLRLGLVEKGDKMMPFFIQDIVGHLKGMPGVFISCVFSAALSTMSATLNSMSGVAYFDYIKPYIKHTEHRANVIMKIFVFVIGAYCVLAGLVVEKFASILQIVVTVGGISVGAVFGVFMLGMLVPRAHSKAAFWSSLASLLTLVVIGIGARGKLNYTPLPSSIEGCSARNMATIDMINIVNGTFVVNETSQEVPADEESGFNLFEMSFGWYSAIGALVVFIIGIPLSYFCAPEKSEKFDPKLLSPIVKAFVKYEMTHLEELPEVISK